MIITASDIRSVRPVAQNINDAERLHPYIEEVEQLYVIPAITPQVYSQIVKGGVDWIDELKAGGFYNDSTEYFAGLTAAMAYLAYSRLIRNQSTNVTAFGVVFKNGELSEKADEATIARMSNEAQEIGVKHLQGCVQFLQYKGVIPCNAKHLRGSRIRVIG